MNRPLVSVVIPAYNASKYIKETLESVLNQTYSNLEIIIIDDGSTDNTKQIVEELMNKDQRIKYYYQENQGVSVARNNGIKKSNGEFIAFLDADDIWEENNVEMKLETLNTYPEVDFVYSDAYLLEKTEKTLIKRGTDKNIHIEMLLWQKEVIPVIPSNIIVKKEIIIKNNLFFDENISTAADRDYAIYLSRYTRGKLIQAPLISYRNTPGSMSKNIQLMEKDFIYVYEKLDRDRIFPNFIFKLRAFSNLYLILSGSFWVNANNKYKGIYYLLKAILFNPFVILKLSKKVLK